MKDEIMDFVNYIENILINRKKIAKNISKHEKEWWVSLSRGNLKMQSAQFWLRKQQFQKAENLDKLFHSMKSFKIFQDPVESKTCHIEEAIIANKSVKMVLRILVMGLKLWVLLHGISFERKDCVFRKRTKTYRYRNKRSR